MIAQPRVLIVDDDPHVVDALERGLRREPFRIRRASNAVEALCILDAEPIDVIVSDDQMPGLRGIDLLIEARKRRPETACIVLTGSPCVGLAIRAINDVGVARFLTKPCAVGELVAAIRSALAARPAPASSPTPAGARVYEIEDPGRDVDAWLESMRVRRAKVR